MIEVVEEKRKPVGSFLDVIPVIAFSCFMLFVVLYVGNYIFTALEKEITKPLPTTPFTTLVVLVILMIPIIVVLSVSKFSGGYVDEDEEGYYIDTNDIAFEPGKLRVKDAREILRIRYAKGEINSVEYTERMARL